MISELTQGYDLGKIILIAEWTDLHLQLIVNIFARF